METANFPGFDSLTNLGAHRGVDMRPTLLRVLTDLYVQRLSHSPAEERRYTELALRLLESVNVPARLAVARRLARHPAPPLRVLRLLAADLPEVAAAVRSHPLLRSAAPIDAANSAAAPVAAPAAPTALTPPRTPAAAADAGAPRHQAVPADAPGVVDPVTAGVLNKLFFAADATERRLIVLNLDLVAPLPADRVVVAGDPDIGQKLEAAALARNREVFAQHLAHALNIPRQQAGRIVRDDLGEPVVVAAKVLGLAADALHRILLFLNPAVGHSVERVHALAALYQEMSRQAAAGLVAIWQALEKDERAISKYRPQTWDDQGGARPPQATPLRRVPAAPATRERRGAR